MADHRINQHHEIRPGTHSFHRICGRRAARVEPDGSSEAILPFPIQNALTRPLRTAAAQQGRAEFLSLWAGQGVRLARRQSAADLIARLVNETEAAIARL